MKEQFTQLANGYAWIEIPSKNPYMISFQKEEDSNARINYYFTTGTLTIQSWNTPCTTVKNCTLDQFEDLLIAQKKT